MTGERAAGFSLIEIVVAMTLTLAVFAITLPFVRAQTRALGTSAGRLDADQIARYAQRAIDRDLRLATAVDGQPLLVLAGPFAISFNANLFASDTTDPGAADIEAGGATTLTESWAVADAATLPNTSRSYPPQAYLDGSGATSHSETISYFLHPDTITGRNDIYVLYRRVNARDSVQIVRGLHVPADSAFFNYQRPVGGVLTRIADSRLPLYWDSAAVDSVRAVGIRAAGYYHNNLTGSETIRTVQWSTVIANASGRTVAGCGAAPAAVSNVGHNKITSSSGYNVRVTWDASSDDNAGAHDVRYYLIGLRLTADVNYTVVGSVPGRGVATYRWDHFLPTLVGSVKYGVRAVDCAGGVSAWVTHSSALNIP